MLSPLDQYWVPSLIIFNLYKQLNISKKETYIYVIDRIYVYFGD